MGRRVLSLMGMAFCCMAICHAQHIDAGKSRSDMDEFVKEITDDFNNFRRESMQQFAAFVKNPWKEFEETKPIPQPNPTPVPPVILDDNQNKPIKDTPIVIDEVVKPVTVEPQPKPVEPIEEVPVIAPKYLQFRFFGTADSVRLNVSKLPTLVTVNEAAVSAMLQALSSDEFDNLIVDCLNIRNSRMLSDWAYLQMLNTIAVNAYADDRNEAQVLLAYLYMQSGYKMRLASDGKSIYMLFASQHVLFDKNSFYVDGERYYGVNALPQTLRICQVSFPKEKPLSLFITTDQQFADSKSDNRTIVSKKYPAIRLDVSVNKNLMDFYSTYPSSAINGNIMTRWAMYANTPMNIDVTSTLYPALRKLLENKTELEATNMLLNTIQTGLKYEYDDVVWGCDRAFFAEETLFYPFCDCEDRAILLTRLVRDLLGLKCLLVYYPGHLAAAIEFSDSNTPGDYILLDGHRYTIADPTYINAPVGLTMPGMDNATATAIQLR